jgi:hypothetical protein
LGVYGASKYISVTVTLAVTIPIYIYICIYILMLISTSEGQSCSQVVTYNKRLATGLGTSWPDESDDPTIDDQFDAGEEGEGVHERGE